MSLIKLCFAALVILLCFSCNNTTSDNKNAKTASISKLSDDEIVKIVRDAYIYGFPLVDNYRFIYAQTIDKSSKMYYGDFNTFFHQEDVKKAGDATVQTPNTETPYSKATLDLRTEPIVLTIKPVEKGRYFSMQLIDMYTHNFAYVGTRTTGNDGGNFLLAGPSWKGEIPKGITKVITCETEIMLIIGRTQLFNPEDLPNVLKTQQGYTIQPLSHFLGQPAPTAAKVIDFIPAFKNIDELKTSFDFFNQLNFVLQFCPVHTSEKDLMARFAAIGIEPGKKIDSTALTPEMKKAFEEGIKDAWNEFVQLQKKAEAGQVTSVDIFGTREELKNNYLYRWAGDYFGIYGNTAAEAIYPGYQVDSDGQPLDATTNKYVIHMGPGEIPPVNAFWSITMYDMPNRFLVKNSIDRYLINSTMINQLKKDKEGGITIYLQPESPGKEKENNWLPTPKGPFFTVMRLYWPKQEALNGTWKQPPLKKVK